MTSDSCLLLAAMVRAEMHRLFECADMHPVQLAGVLHATSVEVTWLLFINAAIVPTTLH